MVMEAIRNNLILLWMEPILDNSSITQIIMNIQLTLWWTQTTYLCLIYSINTLGQNQVEGYLCTKLSNKKWCYLWLWIYCIFLTLQILYCLIEQEINYSSFQINVCLLHAKNHSGPIHVLSLLPCSQQYLSIIVFIPFIRSWEWTSYHCIPDLRDAPLTPQQEARFYQYQKSHPAKPVMVYELQGNNIIKKELPPQAPTIPESTFCLYPLSHYKVNTFNTTELKECKLKIPVGRTFNLLMDKLSFLSPDNFSTLLIDNLFDLLLYIVVIVIAFCIGFVCIYCLFLMT